MVEWGAFITVRLLSTLIVYFSEKIVNLFRKLFDDWFSFPEMAFEAAVVPNKFSFNTRVNFSL